MVHQLHRSLCSTLLVTVLLCNVPKVQAWHPAFTNLKLQVGIALRQLMPSETALNIRPYLQKLDPRTWFESNTDCDTDSDNDCDTDSDNEKNTVIARLLLEEDEEKRVEALREISDSQGRTQSEAHLWCCHDIVRPTFAQYLSDDICKIFDAMNTHERKLIAQGKHVFYHGQKWSLYFLEDLFTHLWQMKYRQNLRNFLFARFDRIDFTDMQQTKQDELIREKFLQGKEETWPDGNISPRLLFANHAIFGNTQFLPRCSAHYFLEDTGNLAVRIDFDSDAQLDFDSDAQRLAKWLSTRTIFAQLQLDEFYSKFEDEIDSLNSFFHLINGQHRGNMLQIAIDTSITDKCVYPARGGGNRRTVSLYPDDQWAPGQAKEVRKASAIVDALKLFPKRINNVNFYGCDRPEYVIILTQDLALRPNNGVEIFAFNAVDPEQWQEYERRRDVLIAKIEKANEIT